MKRTLATLLSLLMLVSLVGGFSTAIAEEPVTVEFFYSPWASTPHDGYDPYEEYIEEKYGVDFILTPATDFETQLLTRAAGGNMPDVILFNSLTQLMQLYNQGVLLDDWTPYLENMPQTTANMSDLARNYLSVDGKIVACPAQAGDQKWSFCIRQDWLEALGLTAPTSDEEFLDVLRAFTFNDPDGNGEADTYGFTSAGGNTGVGELRNLLKLYSAGNFYITEDGAVEHFMTDGSFLQYLQLARTIVSEGLIDPDWFTQGWDERKPSLYSGKYGVCWYPMSALLAETDSLYNDDGATATSMWTLMPTYTGALDPDPIHGALRTVSAEAAANPAKMEAICGYLENGAFPNEDFFILRMGYKVDAKDILQQTEDGAWFLGQTDPAKEPLMAYGSIMFGWGQMIQAQGANVVESKYSEPSALNIAAMSEVAKWQAEPKYPGDQKLLNPDPTLIEESNKYIAEFEIAFILGDSTEDDYEGFVETWKDLYGNALFEDATATFTSYGLIG